MGRFTKHLMHYIPLVGILAAGLSGFYYFSYDRGFQAAIVLATATSYVAWGLIHHHVHDDLHLSVVIEYVAVAVVGMAIVFSLIFRA